MIIVDSSAWIELLRGTESDTHRRLRTLVSQEADLAITELIFMELLSCAGSNRAIRELRGRLLAYPFVRLEGLADFEEAAAIYRGCRNAGETPRRLADCLIAATAIRVGGELLHMDADFEVIARHSPLQVFEPG